MKTKRTIHRLALVFSGILLFQTVHSQEKYLPGYIINLKADTLSGYIDYRNWKINPDKISFKELMENKEIVYRPSDIIEFKVKDEIYVSAVVNIETSPRSTDDLNFDQAMHLTVDTAFLQTIYKGKKSLYYYFNHGMDYFYIRQDTTFELLLYKRYFFSHDNQNIVLENKAYLGQLSFYLNDCPGIEARLKSTAYKQTSLSNLFKYYYEMTQSEISFKKEEEKIKGEFGILAGTSITSLAFSGTGPVYLVGTDYNPSFNFSAGVFCDLVFPRNQRKWSLYNELLYSAYKVNDVYEDYASADKYTIITSELGFSYLKINTLVRFKYPVGRSYLFINGGISNGFLISETNYKKEQTKFYTQETTVEGVALEDTRKYEQGFILGLGMKSGRYSLEARYETGNGMSTYADMTASAKRIFVLFGYKF